MGALTKTLNTLYSVVEAMAHALMIGLFVIVNMGVVSRYVLNAPFVWTEELALFALSWMVFLSGSLLIRDWDNLRVTYFIERLPKALRGAIELASKLIVLGFLVFMLTVAATVIPQVGPSEHSPALGIPMHIPMMSLVSGLALMVVQLAGLLLEIVTGYLGRRGG